MYIDKIEIENFRTFRKSHIDFIHPQQNFEDLGLPPPRLKNVNLLMGNNGLGKTTLLKAIALASLGPAVGSSGLYPNRLVRREPKRSESAPSAKIEAEFIPHEQDQVEYSRIESRIEIVRKGDLEELQWTHPDDKSWHPIYSSSSDAFFFVGYGATRRVEKRDQVDIGSRRGSLFVRAQRVQSLFEEAYSLVPLNSWLPQFQYDNPGRYKQVVTLITKLMGEGHYEFTGEMEEHDYIFNRNGLKVPFGALSDGYRAFIGWVGDLLYHVCMTASTGEMLRDNKGIVMVDEIDLHLHPKWQMTILQTLSEALPNIQFIVTSHSPLIVGSMEWMNIIVMLPQPGEASETKRIEWAVHGLDADQVLLTDFFGMDSTRAPGKNRRLKELSLQARNGDTEAAKMLLTEMSGGMEVK